MKALIRATALTALFAAAPAAQAATLCDSIKAIMAGMDATPMFSGLTRAENNRPVGKIVPDGWVRCTTEQYEENTGRYTCYAAGGAPQATVQAHLAEVRGELVKCFGVTGSPPTDYGMPADELDFLVRKGDPLVSIRTYTEGMGQPDGGIRFSIEYIHPA